MNTATKSPNQHTNADDPARRVFADPVGYLASFGISAVVVSETTALRSAA